jgi:hypothetical protein
MEVLLILVILVVALVMFAAYRASKHGGDQTLDGSVHEQWRKSRKGGGGGGGFAGG